MYTVHIVNENAEPTCELIDDTRALQLLNDFKTLRGGLKICQYYKIVRDNINDLLEAIDKKQVRDKQSQLLEIARFLCNATNSIYSFTSFIGKTYGKAGENLRNNLYKSSFDYRVLFYLRHSLIHDDTTITQSETTYDVTKITNRFIISKSTLLNSSTQKNAAFRKELAEIKEKNIDITQTILNFIPCLETIIIELLYKSQEPNLSFARLTSLIGCNLSVFLCEDGRVINDLRNIVTRYYENYTKCVAYYGGVLTKNKELLTCYEHLSYLYFGDANSFYIPKS